MMRFAILAALVLGIFMLDAPAHSQDPAKITPDEAVALQGALNRGLLLRRYDQAAWHTTDALLEDIPDAAEAGIKGWIVVEGDRGLRVIYWRPTETGFEAVYTAVYSRSEVVERTINTAEIASLSGEEIELIRALEAVDPSGLARCSSKPFNRVVMPTEKPEGGHYVYYLTPQEKSGSIPLGGHYRFEVRDGKVVDQREFTKSCISLASANSEEEEDVSALVIAHLLDPVPTEIHVFSVFAGGLPIYVSTVENDKFWVVEVSSGQPRTRLIHRE